MKKLTVRDIRLDELEALRIRPIRRFALPDLDSELYCCRKVVVDSTGNIVGVGIARLTSEVILVVDDSAPRTLKARVVKHLHDVLRHALSTIGMDEAHAFIEDTDPELRCLLKRKFGFKECSARPVYCKF